ncbi:MAG TPA: tRNA lysidine(34) synthetase TilS [Edaphobacter sp.]|jgi:tRNA(Ile)-lysidine synthase|nr:tRNA lysidine(34) synthetase TilS [Edaphobacter sp.]
MLPFDRTHLKPGDRICIAISGGADSVALLLTLHAANEAKRDALGVGLSAVHINHHLRGEESNADQQFVEDLCINLDISLHLHQADVQQRAAAKHETIEEAARNARYEFFSTLLSSGHADAILTAHTLDDQAETVLMKLLRGAWTEGLSGIHPVLTLPKGKILRPFLQTRRAEIESFLKSIPQPWREDSTNADTAFTRNKIRHQLLPQLRDQLRAYNPNLDQTLANLAELAREEESRWQTELSRILPQLLLPGKPVRGGGRAVPLPISKPIPKEPVILSEAQRAESKDPERLNPTQTARTISPHKAPTPAPNASISIELDRLRALDPALRRRVIRAAARQLGARLSFDETSRLLALCGFQPYPPVGTPTVAARTGASLHLANNLRADRSPRELRLFLQK